MGWKFIEKSGNIDHCIKFFKKIDYFPPLRKRAIILLKCYRENISVNETILKSVIRAQWRIKEVKIRQAQIIRRKKESVDKKFWRI